MAHNGLKVFENCKCVGCRSARLRNKKVLGSKIHAGAFYGASLQFDIDDMAKRRDDATETIEVLMNAGYMTPTELVVHLRNLRRLREAEERDANPLLSYSEDSWVVVPNNSN